MALKQGWPLISHSLVLINNSRGPGHCSHFWMTGRPYHNTQNIQKQFSTSHPGHSTPTWRWGWPVIYRLKQDNAPSTTVITVTQLSSRGKHGVPPHPPTSLYFGDEYCECFFVISRGWTVGGGEQIKLNLTEQTFSLSCALRASISAALSLSACSCNMHLEWLWLHTEHQTFCTAQGRESKCPGFSVLHSYPQRMT